MGTTILVSTNANVACGAGSAVGALSYTAPSGIAAKVKRFGISFDGTASTDARATVDFLKKPSTAGTSTNISSEIAVVDGLTTTLGAAAQAFTSTQPASDANSRVIRPHLMAPTGPYEAVINVALAPSEMIVMRTLGASGKTCRAWMEIELG